MRVKKLISFGIFLILAATIQENAKARPFTEFEQVVVAQMEQEIEARLGSGYRLLYKPSMGLLSTGAEAPFTLLLEAGNDYNFTAVCDQDCNDVDLIIRDENGNEVESDIAPDDIPVISFSPEADGRYQVIVKIQNCNDPGGQCNFGMGLFGKEP